MADKKKKKPVKPNPLALAVKSAGEAAEKARKDKAKKTAKQATNPLAQAVSSAGKGAKKLSENKGVKKAQRNRAKEIAAKKTVARNRVLYGGEDLPYAKANVGDFSGRQSRKHPDEPTYPKHPLPKIKQKPTPMQASQIRGVEKALGAGRTRDSVDIARANGINVDPEKAKQGKVKAYRAENQRQRDLNKQKLSRADRNLGKGAKEIVRQAKNEYDKAKAAGDKAGMEKAHAKAEGQRAFAGYSGGAAGDEYLSPKLSREDRNRLNAQGEKALKKAKLDYDKAKAAGDAEGMKAAAERGQEVRRSRGYQDRPGTEHTAGNDTSIDYATPEERERWGRQTAAAAKAGALAIPASLLSFQETASQATRNLIHNKQGASDRELADNIESIRDQLRAAQRGEPTYASEAQLQRLYERAQAANRRIGIPFQDFVDPNLPGQRLMRKSQEYTAEALQGKTGVDRLLTQAGISMLQNTPSMGLALIPGVGPAIGAGLMGAQAAGAKSYDLNERGISPTESFGRGLVSGGIEAATERIPLGSLARIVRGEGGQSVLKNIARQAGIEATEEGAAYVGNYIADKAAQDPEAMFDLRELAENAAVGAISGAAFGGAGTAINTAVRRFSNARSGNPLLDTVRRAEGRTEPQEGPVVEEEQVPAPVQEQSAQERLRAMEKEYAEQAEDLTRRWNNANPQARRALLQEQADLRQREQAIIQERARLRREEAAQEEAEPVPPVLEEVPTPEESPEVPLPPAAEEELRQEVDIPPEGRIINEEDAVNSVGAAPRGFDPYTRAANEYGTIEPGENPARIIDVPQSTDGQDRVRRFARTALEAEITNPETIERLEQDIINGGFSYHVRKDKASMDKAVQTIEEKGAMGALRQWMDVVEGRRTASKDDMVLAQLLYVNAERSGDTNLAAQLAAQIAAEGTVAGQNVQALRLLKQATPEGRIYYMRKIVGKINEDLAKKGTSSPKDRETGFSKEAVSKIVSDLQTERDDAIRTIQSAIEAFQPKQTADGETLGWVENLGKDLASHAVRRTGPERQTPVYQIISRDLGAFMDQYITREKQRRPARTTVDRLTDYFQNKEEYTRAWDIAKQRLLEKYRNNPDVLASIQEFLGSDIIGPNSKLMAKAVASSALERDVSLRNLVVRSDLDRTGLVRDIADDLISKTNAKGEDALAIEEAVEEYISSRLDAASRSSSDYINSGIKSAMKEIGTKVSEILKTGAAERADLASQISDMLIQEYGISEASAQTAANAIQAQFNAMLQEGAQRKLTDMFRDRPTPARRTTRERFDELIKLGAFSDPNFSKLATEKLFQTDQVELNQNLIQRYLEAETDAEQTDALNEIYDDVVRQMPRTASDALTAWRYFAMLGNPRTHIRNILGNVLFGGVRNVSNELSSVLQRAAIRDPGQRSRAIKSTPAARAFAREDYLEMKDALSGTKYADDMSEIRRRQQERALGPFSFLSKANSRALSAEDNFFKKGEYIRSLASYITAQGWDPANLSRPQLQAARTHAMNDALEATFQEANIVASKLAEIERINPITKVAIGGAFPFKGVPVNIAKEGFRYSPAGLIKAVTADAAKVRSGDMTAAQMIDNLSSGLTGTGIAILGYWLSSLGLVNAGASDDDKERAMDIAQGTQNYSLNIGPYSYTIDWAAPSALPFFIGAEFQKMMEEEEADEDGNAIDKKFGKAMDSLERMFEPMLNMTVLSGVSNALRSAAYNQSNPFTAVGGSVATGFAGQVVPTLLGQIARTVDPVRRSTYVDKDSGVPSSLQRFIQTQQNKIPGLSQRNVPYLDVWGNETVQDNPLIRALQNFVSPGYIAQRRDSAVDDELRRLDSLGYDGVLPSMRQKGQSIDLNHDGEKERLTMDQWEEWQKSQGQTAKTLLDDLLASQAYQSMSDDEKAASVKRIIDFSKDNGKLEIGGSEEGVDKWVLNAREFASRFGGGSPQGFFDAYNQKSAIDKNDYSNGVKQGMLEDYINAGNQPQEAKNYLLDSIKFWSMNPANSKNYQKAKSDGYTDPAEIDALLQRKKDADTNENGSYTQDELRALIVSMTDDPAEQARLYDVYKNSNWKKTWNEVLSGSSGSKKKSSSKKSSSKSKGIVINSLY